MSQAELAPPGISQKNSKTGHLDQDGAGPQSPIWKAVNLWSNAWKFESWMTALTDVVNIDIFNLETVALSRSEMLCDGDGAVW